MERLRKNKGITLIALVITIIVLLILAGVTINLTLGQNGIFTTAQKAAKNYTNTQEKELADINDFTNTVDQTIQNINGENGGTSTEGGESTGGENPQTNPTLVSQITASDYGKSINYSVTVNGTVLSDWKVFYNDGTNVYIILSDYLNNTLIPAATGMTTEGTYQAYWANGSVPGNTEAVATLTNTSNWSAFARGNGGSSAIGSPTNEMFVASWNANPNTNAITLSTGYIYDGGLTDSTGLYIPHTSEYEGCWGYWFATPYYYSSTVLCNAYIGAVGYNYYNDVHYGVRPVVCLTSGITGIVGDSVTID